MAQFFLSRWLFFRLLGLVYLVAFLSAWSQVQGLIGSRGILPVTEFLARVHEQVGAEAYWRLPTLFWLDDSDTMLEGVCLGGVVLAVLLAVGVAPLPISFLLWACYLSLVNVGQEFFQYQWDGLLLESGLLAILYAPWGYWPTVSKETAPSPVLRWLFCWLLFRLMFASGIAKLMGGESWRDLTALQYHYETQPLPMWTSWYIHQLPHWLHAASVLCTFAAEIVAPPLLFLGRRCRHVAALIIVILQVLIAATGNYGFFNLLTIALCITQLDDSVFPKSLRSRLMPADTAPVRESLGRTCVTGFAAVMLVLLSLVPFLANLHFFELLPRPLQQGYQAAAAFHPVNSYGLFAVMTTKRHEIVVEGSDDGVTWKAYLFRYKPGDLEQPPRFAWFHLPRLDWQMWFAALGRYEDNPWFERFLLQLHEGAPEVLELLEHNPFPDAPRNLRALIFDYRFTTFGASAWWRRALLGSYTP
ncbi:MAG: lipase maturation factor family protein [Gemmataceae bacterium]|nr:lipase maturation factor family protein [Gemmataceae bacterium]MCI0742744.1 lipase maturation factor family protein [Gemmataceae bacterium]